jgi:hypothetical protein
MDAKDLIVYNPNRKTFEIGDGQTLVSQPWEKPLTSEEKIEPSFYDVTIDLNNVCVDFAVNMTEVFAALLKEVVIPLGIWLEENKDLVDTYTNQREQPQTEREHRQHILKSKQSPKDRPFDPNRRHKKGRQTWR